MRCDTSRFNWHTGTKYDDDDYERDKCWLTAANLRHIAHSLGRLVRLYYVIGRMSLTSLNVVLSRFKMGFRIVMLR